MDHLKLPTLLMVSETPSVRFWIKKHLSEQFFIIDTPDFKAALEAAKNSRLDFIIIDSDFENCNPLKLSAELRKTLDPFIPILLITGRLKKSFLDAALEAGVTDFLNNQLDSEELHLRIATGRKAQSLRDKTSELSFAIAKKKDTLSSDYLKSKFFLHDQTLRWIANAKKKNIALMALFIRIDHFEEIQTKIGYLVSAETLLPLSNLLSDLLKKSDLLIPMSEGRFIILLQNTTSEEAKNLAEKCRAKVAETPFNTKNGPVHLSISMTLSSLQATEGAFNRIVDLSVQALKEADAVANLILPIEP
jgi:diguanylate cyclase (GGDEF)-like protein